MSKLQEVLFNIQFCGLMMSCGRINEADEMFLKAQRLLHEMIEAENDALTTPDIG